MKSNDENIKKEIGLRIQTLRKQSGMTAGDLQQVTGIGLSTLQNYEAGLRQPSIPAIKKIAHALKASAPYIACLTDNPFPPQNTNAPVIPGLVAIKNDIASHAGEKPVLAIEQEILRSKNINPSSLSVLQSNDELMSPTISPGSQVLINTDDTEIHEGIYALEDRNGQVVLRHCRVIPGDNAVMLSTERDAEMNTKHLNNEEFKRYKVLGRVVSVVNWL
ncbi:XRE family transcriptional regulator [Escherichia coli]|uniref:XRE family transcriptional regulator n=1 Tax=Escherichia coli TaxID=562 RepID=UPI000BE811ED|nr:helix-turn-helix domain-containing protein [Escherichia coli]BBK60874.1 repressor protein [Escherichia coli O145:H28]HBJ0171892.1 helix-turn-helix domain-containing protein [Escherichia coli]HBJ1081943.1 helix-turn-helix domain-containing protein [Escherichia coli]HBJ1212980.1 helix-turn-helix domain-containing protein [Escherichia coli]